MNVFAFADEIIKIIDKRKYTIAEHLIRGSAQDYEHYRSLTSKISGFDESKQIILDFVKSLENNNPSY